MKRRFTFYAVVKLDELLEEWGGSVARVDLGEAMHLDTGGWGEFPDDEDEKLMCDEGVEIVLTSWDTARHAVANDLWKKLPRALKWRV